MGTDESKWLWPILRGEVKQQDAAEDLGLYQNEISRFARRYVREFREEYFNERTHNQAKWDNELLKAHPDNFVRWRKKYFRDRKGQPYITPPHQKIWVEEILRTIKEGGQLSIMAPPRHGKSDLLAHFCIWQILINPNIMIMWIGGNDDIAKLSLAQVRDELQNNKKIQADFNNGNSFAPDKKSGLPWSTNQFTIGTRTVTGLRSPTMVAIGRGAKILSRDADWIITDDLEDEISVRTEGARETTRNYFFQNIGTRKEDHTGWVNIGSRQHIEDIHGKLLENTTWDSIVNVAHDPACELEEHDDEKPLPRGHTKQKNCPICDKHVECCLFPQLRTYKYLVERREALGKRIFNMTFQNSPEDAGSLIFLKQSVDACLNKTRRFRDIEWIKQNTSRSYLIAGLDPSATQYQASVLKAYDPETQKRFIVDLENRLGGGVRAVRETIQKWYEMYECRMWVIEENLYHGGITDDEKLINYCGTNGIQILGHLTNAQNKWDSNYGISAMGPLFDEGLYDIPYRDQNQLIKEYRKQLLSFSHQPGVRKKDSSDLVMADWFTEVGIRMQGWHREIEIIDTSSTYGYPTPYGDMYSPLMGDKLVATATKE